MSLFDYAQRLTAVRQKLTEWEVDAVHITSEANRRWLSGFTGSNAQCLITANQAILATDSRYFERAKTEAPAFSLFKHERRAEDSRALFKLASASRIGIEKKHVTLDQAAKFRALRTGIKWVPLPETIEPLRAHKNATEMELMRQAAAMTDTVMAQIPNIARIGQTERQLAWELEKMLREAGADEMAFPIIVASGPNRALPHHAPSPRPLQAGDPLIVDMGAKLHGYHSDLTLSFHLGAEPSTQFWQIYNLVKQANENVFKNLRPGMALLETDALARNIINDAGFKDNFGHGLGHGVGLEIHEDPFLSPRAAKDAVIQAGMNITIEPGIYVPGWGGIRLEDFAYLAADGLQSISQCPKQPIIAF
jgi:Xaa-Pro aminopeptidase